MRTMTIKEYLLEEMNKELAKDGVQLVDERPKPELATREGEVVQLRATQRKDSERSLFD